MLCFSSVVHVSALKISIEDKVILKKSFTILCQSNGSLPINYTLFKDNVQVGTKVIREQNRQAVFMDVINEPGERQYRCEAKNSLHSNKTGSSQHLSVNVIGKYLSLTDFFCSFLYIFLKIKDER